MNIYIERTKQEEKMSFSGTVKELLDQLNIVSEEVLVLKNEELVQVDETLEDLDEIKILSVISGG